MEIDIRPDELYHHGRKGMKWYQNIFSKDKKSGSSRRKKSRTDQSEEMTETPKPKSHKDMTDDELRRQTDRYNLEANYLNARNRVEPQSSPTQKKESFTKKFVNDAVKPAIIAAGRTQIEKYLNTQVEKLTKGKVKPTEMETLQKVKEKLDLEKQISQNKKIIATNEDFFAKRKRDADAEKQAEADKAKRQETAKATDKFVKDSHEQISEQAKVLRRKQEIEAERQRASQVNTKSENSTPDVVSRGEQEVIRILDRFGDTMVNVNVPKKNKEWWE